jgi:iron complex outermembrane receptor protein
MKVGGDVLYTYRDAVRPLQIVRPDGSPVTPPFYDSEQVWPGVTIVQEGGFVNLERTLGSVRLAATGRIDFAQSDAERPSSVFLENTGASASDLDQNDAMLSGALTASLPLSDRWTLSVGGGSVARPPTALERYADRFPATKAQTSAEFQGNPFLEPERSNQADLWLAGGTRTWTVRLSGFARRITNYVTLQPTSISPLLPLSPETVFRYVNGDATFVGAEASGQWAVADPVTVRASGSWLWGQDDRLDEPALGVAPLQGRLGARWRLPVSGQSLSRLYLDGTLRAVARQGRVAETRGETATDGYATVALTAGARFWRRIELEAGVENLFDVTVANHLNANNPFRGIRVPEPGRVVSLDLTVDF